MSPAEDDAQRWQRSPDVLWRRGEFGVVVARRASEQPVRLEGVAVALWDFLDAPVTVEETSAWCAEVYDGEPSVVASDVRSTLNHLADLGVIRAVS